MWSKQNYSAIFYYLCTIIILQHVLVIEFSSFFESAIKHGFIARRSQCHL